MNIFSKAEARTPLVELSLLKQAFGFASHIPVAQIIQYIEDGVVSVKHEVNLVENTITETEASSLAAQAAFQNTPDAPDVLDPAKVVETPTHLPEATSVNPVDAKAETAIDKQDDTKKDVVQDLKDAKQAEKEAPKGPEVVKDEDKKALSEPVDDKAKK